MKVAKAHESVRSILSVADPPPAIAMDSSANYADSRGCYLLKLKFFILKSATTGDQVEPYIVADTQPETPESTFNPMQSGTRRSNGVAAPEHTSLTSRPSSAVPSEVPSSKTLSNDPLSGTIPQGITRAHLARLDELAESLGQLRIEYTAFKQDMKKREDKMALKDVVVAQESEIRSLRSQLILMQDRVGTLEAMNRAKPIASNTLSYPYPTLVNGQKRSFSQSNGVPAIPLASRESLLSQGESSYSNLHGRDTGMKEIVVSVTPSNDGDDPSEKGTNAATSELATRHMVPSSVSESNGDVAGEMVVIGATNTAAALEELGPGEANGGWGSMANQFHVFTKPSLPVKKESGYLNGPGESQTSEYVPSGVSTDTNATHDIRPASFVPLNRNHHLEPSRQQSFDSPPVLEGWDNSQDMDYRPSGDISTGSTRGTPEGLRFRRGIRLRGSGSGGRGDREAIKFKNYSARLTEPAPWESEDWDGTTGATLIRSPSSRGRTVRQRGQSSTTRTLDFETPTGVRKKLKGDSDPRPRDAAGRLLRANGMVDRRSERYHRKKTIPNTQSDASPLSMGGSATPATPASAATTPVAPSNNHRPEPHAAVADDDNQQAVQGVLPPGTPANYHLAAGHTTDSPKTHEEFMLRIFPKGRPAEEAVDDNEALR